MPAVPSVTLPPELDRVLRDYERAWEAQDAAALASLFTDDGFVLSNGRPPVRGSESIRSAYADAGGGLSLRALAYGVEGSTGYIIGGFAPAKGATDIGKFVLVLRKEKLGRWLIVADMDNANRSPRVQAPPAE